MTDREREERLPLWARSELDDLRRNIRELEQRNHDLLPDHPGTRITRREWSGGEEQLPDHSKIVFTMDPTKPRGTDIMVYFDLDDRLTVQCDRGVVIHPQASNAFRLELRD